MEKTKSENEKYVVVCDEAGSIIIKDKETGQERIIPALFGENFYYQHTEWDVAVRIYITPDCRYIIVTYGIGHIYLIDACAAQIIKRVILFEEISYEDISYQSIDPGCYYNEYTRIDFNNTGRYAAIRVRGDYDPQDADGRDELTTPLYFRSVFLLDLSTLDICFQETFEDVEERSGRNIAAIAFSPQDNYFVVGALGNQIKIFSLEDNRCVGNYMSLGWISDPSNIEHCRLICFLAEDAFIYVNRNYNIQRNTKVGADWSSSGILYTNLPPNIQVSPGVISHWSYIEDIELNRKAGTVRCRVAGNRADIRGDREYQLEFI